MIKWLVLNEDDEIRFVCDTRYSAEVESANERINDVYQGFTPDEHRFVQAKYVGDTTEKMPYSNLWCGAYDLKNWEVLA